MRVLGDINEAEDAVQDAMIKVWRHLGRFEGRAAFTTWLHRIAVNAALDRPPSPPPIASPRTRRQTKIAMHAARRHRPSTETPERDLRPRGRRPLIRGAMERLSSAHGEALRLCDLEGESYATIATRADCPPGHGDVAALPCAPQPGARAHLVRDRYWRSRSPAAA